MNKNQFRITLPLVSYFWGFYDYSPRYPKIMSIYIFKFYNFGKCCD